MKQYQLPKEFAEKWVEALRSKQYRQTKGCFTKGEDCFCALGLGYFMGGAIPIKNTKYSGWTLIGLEPLDNYMYPLFDVITKMNDTGVKFPKIADWIESNVEFI